MGRAEPTPLGRAAWCFPLVGLAVGAVVGGVFMAATALGLSDALAGFLGVAAGVALTGALHEDGLADMADGLGAAERERALEIMRDGRIGAFGALALGLTLPMRALALAAAGPAAALAAHALSRGAMAAAMAWTPPARKDGLAASAGEARAGWALLLAAGVAVALGWQALPAAALAALGVAWLAWRRFGGHTGDALGAVQQLAELAALLALAAAR